ncbi:MAG: glycerol kinase GlpK [Deltaproteobacteria bacterium]|nr:glycerol kinase GlpK [Deltaproteobacteria bacterium]
MPEFILALDQGTTATTALVIREDLAVSGRASNEIPQRYPQPGWVEHSPEAIWAATTTSARQAMAAAGVDGRDCLGIGITNQRETTILWDRATGAPRFNGVVWQDRRTAPACERMKADGLEPLFRRKTGLVLDPYFSGTKVRWLLDEVPGLRADAEAGRVAFGTVDCFLVWRLTGGRTHATDVSNASRTLLLDLASLTFDPELLAALRVPEALLPRVVPSSGEIGRTHGLDFLPDGVPIAGIAGDQQAALFGQTCFAPGQSKCTYPAGAFLLVNTGAAIAPSRHGLLTTVAWSAGGETAYALEGSAFIAGAAVQWLRDGLGIIRKAPEIEALAASVPDSGGVVFVPALAGLGAPHWKPDARGAVLGITRGTTAAHLARAVLDGIAFEVADLIDAMGKDLGRPVAELRVDGGACVNDLLMQTQADVTGVQVVRPRNVETTAMGAAMLAGMGVGLWDRAALAKLAGVDREFRPAIDAAAREARVAAYREGVRRVV